MRRVAVAIVQEYVPRYRVGFFSGLVELLYERGIECFVIAGSPVGSQAVRGDSTGAMPWLRRIEPHRVTLGKRSIYFYGTPRHWRACDGVIMELRGTSLDLNAELLQKGISSRRVGVWGHVKPFVTAGNPIDLEIERRQMRRSDHVFAYTESGAEYAMVAGASPSRVTCVMNSTDVSNLLAASRAIDVPEVQRFRVENDLTLGKSFGCIGGLDIAKRVDFLVEVLDRLWELDRDIKLVVGGRGDQEDLLMDAIERGQVVSMGFVGDAEKALIFKSCEALLNPGRVGLIAVECMALGLPILTTDWPFHAPEYEYLTEGEDVFVSANSVEDFADLVLSHSKGHATFRDRQGRDYPTLEQMIDNFARGIQAMMD
jgi:glycosyltransferase involved in cell wall biosynthesis